MATLTVQNITRSGLSPTYAAAAGGGDFFLPGNNTFLHVKNGSGSAITVGVDGRGTYVGDLTVSNVNISVPAGGERMIGPWPAAEFADPSDGLADITYSGVTSLTIAAIELRQP